MFMLINGFQHANIWMYTKLGFGLKLQLGCDSRLGIVSQGSTRAHDGHQKVERCVVGKRWMYLDNLVNDSTLLYTL